MAAFISDWLEDWMDSTCRNQEHPPIGRSGADQQEATLLLVLSWREIQAYRNTDRHMARDGQRATGYIVGGGKQQDQPLQATSAHIHCCVLVLVGDDGAGLRAPGVARYTPSVLGEGM
ncbi:hypothetical protein McaMca56_007475 [Microsporum canis]